MNYWFTADLHLNHRNIILYSERPYRKADGQPDLEAMADAYRRDWLSKVQPGDSVFFLGDLEMGKDQHYANRWLTGLPGQKFWMLGNHDDKRLVKNCSHHFVKIADYYETKIRDQRITLCHFPMLRWNKAHFGAWMLHGHTHGDLEYPYPMRILDVGVDAWGGLVSFDEIKQKMDALPLVQHHYHRELPEDT